MSDIQNIKKLRSLTGAGFKDCSSALEESSGKIDKAIICDQKATKIEPKYADVHYNLGITVEKLNLSLIHI